MSSDDPWIRASFARDASGLELVPEFVARPESEGELLEELRRASMDRLCVTPAGSQTSTTGASITGKGILLSLRTLDAISAIDVDAGTVRVQAGALLGPLKRAIADNQLLLAPDPTSEDYVTIGGAIACNASGPRTLRYGPIRNHVRALRVVLATGEVREFRRPRLEKNTAGYGLAHDPVDWFIGSEGTLGVVLEAELSLLAMPTAVVGLAVPFTGESHAIEFVVAVRKASDLAPRCLEFFDSSAVQIALDLEPGLWSGRDVGAMVYIELDAFGGAEVPFDPLLASAESHGAFVPEITVFDGEAGLRRGRALRHAVPETMNARGASHWGQGGRKISTDWAVPYGDLSRAIAEARAIAAAEGINQPVIYGHAGNGHPHQNFIARDRDEVVRIERAVEATLRNVVALGGTIAAEHGIGKVKRHWMGLQMLPIQIEVMRAVKHALDPLGLLSPGNIFPA